MNKESQMSYTDRLRDAFQRTEIKKSSGILVDTEPVRHKSKNDRDEKANIYERFRSLPSAGEATKVDRRSARQDGGPKIIRHSAVPSSNDASYTPRFEVYDNYTLVAKNSPQTSQKSSSSSQPKSRTDQIIQGHQPTITRKPHYSQNPSNELVAEPIPRIIRSSTALNTETNRSMSAVYKSQTRPDAGVQKSLSNRQQSSTQSVVKTQFQTVPISQKVTNSSGNIATAQNYDSLNRSKHKGSSRITDSTADKQQMFYSLPRKSKDTGKYYGSTKRIPSKQLYIDTDTSRKSRTAPIKRSKDTIDKTAQENTDENLINFSQTLARAATNSPPIKRRSSLLLHSPKPGMISRFATKSTIDEIYTQKNRKDNYEKYKKVASEILKENLALKFGENYPFSNLIKENSLHSSSSSLTSTSSGTDQQNSISSIPPDDIPLDIPVQNKDSQETSNSNELFHPQKSIESLKNDIEFEDNTEIIEGTVTSDVNNIEVVNNVHLSDEDNEDSDEYDLDNEQSSSESYASDSDGDIEQFKKKFVPLHEIERMDDDFMNENEIQEIPDHQHSQSFRIENTSLGSIVEVFVHKESLERAKTALTTAPNHGILSAKRTAESSNVKKRRALFDPHILLLDACLEPDLKLVMELVPKISDISRCTIDGITALHNAVCSADANLVLFLIKSGANINASDADGWTPLHCAACCNNKQISKILVENGASLFAVTLSDFEIPINKCNKTNQEDTQCEQYLFDEQEKLGVFNDGKVYALFEYSPQCSDELPLVPNQVLRVVNSNPPGETGWFIAENMSENGATPKRGFVASNYVSCYPLNIVKPNQ